MHKKWRYILAGAIAGTTTGLLGAGGGMLLLPILSALNDMEESEIFPASISIMLPICVVSLFMTAATDSLPIAESWGYLIGSAFGGLAAGLFAKYIRTEWLHKVLGAMIIYGGIRCLI